MSYSYYWNNAIPPRIPGDSALKSLEVQLLKIEDDLVVEGDVTVGGDVTVTGDVTANAFLYADKPSYTQETSPTTAVPITTNAGTVTTQSLTTATTASTVFTLTGSVILATSKVMLTLVSYSGTPVTNGVPVLFSTDVADGVATITVSNFGANSLSGTLEFNYAII